MPSQACYASVPQVSSSIKWNCPPAWQSYCHGEPPVISTGQALGELQGQHLPLSPFGLSSSKATTTTPPPSSHHHHHLWALLLFLPRCPWQPGGLLEGWWEDLPEGSWPQPTGVVGPDISPGSRTQLSWHEGGILASHSASGLDQETEQELRGSLDFELLSCYTLCPHDS